MTQEFALQITIRITIPRRLARLAILPQYVCTCVRAFVCSTTVQLIATNDPNLFQHLLIYAQKHTLIQNPLVHDLSICVLSASVQLLACAHTRWETPAGSEESIGVAWKRVSPAAGEKSSRSGFHPETVHWCPATLWSPGGNNIQMTFHWRNLIPVSPARDTLLPGWHLCPQTSWCKRSTHTHVHNWKNTTTADPHPTHTLWPPILSLSCMHALDILYNTFLGAYCGFSWYAGKTWE